jgi:hypothetical protein
LGSGRGSLDEDGKELMPPFPGHHENSVAQMDPISMHLGLVFLRYGNLLHAQPPAVMS